MLVNILKNKKLIIGGGLALVAGYFLYKSFSGGAAPTAATTPLSGLAKRRKTTKRKKTFAI